MDISGLSLEGTQLDEIEKLEKLLDAALLEGSQTMKQYFKLGFAYHQRYQDDFKQEDLQSAITHYRNSLKEETVDKDDLGLLLNNLATCLIARFEQLGNTKDLEEAITCYERALSLFPSGHSDRSMSLNNLGIALYTRYQQLGEMKDLEQAIMCHEQALNLCPPGDDSSGLLNNLALTLRTKYEQLGEIRDLEKAITYHEQVLNLHPPGDPDRSMSLNNFALALYTRYDQLGEIKDLEQAIICHKEALSLYPPVHPDRSMSLNNLALALYNRYQQLGEMGDLENAISCHSQALNLRKPGHTLRSSSLNNLALALYTKYYQLGDMNDLENVIIYHEQALDLHPSGHPDRSMSLSNLALALSTRYRQLGEMGDLEKAIAYQEQALKLRLPGHLGRSMSLNKLANSLSIRYGQLGKMEDLEKAITYQEQVLGLCLPGHPDRSMLLNDLAISLSTRYGQLGNRKDLDNAIICHEQALQLRLSSHPERSRSLKNLASALSIRYQEFGDSKDLEEAKIGYEAAFECLSPHHPFHSSVLFDQASLLIIEHQSTWATCYNCSHIDDACTLFILAAHHLTSSLPYRFKAANKWASIAHMHKHTSAIHAYSLALELQQQHLALLPSITSQRKLIENSAQLSLNAASCAISTDGPEMAVQFLEQGRSILWAKIQGYRQSFDQISAKDPQLADEIQAIALQLEHNAVSSDVDITLQRTLSEKWTALVREIRKLDGFSDYLQAIPFKVLQNAAAEGPVIMVNISDFQSDAIILVPDASPVVVSLCDASPHTLKQLWIRLVEVTTGTKSSKDVVLVLQHLWDVVVQPVLKQLVKLKVPQKSRIWWCPTSYLCALPIHAAGPYKRGLKNLPDLYISSYTPTLASLMRARSSVTKPQSTSNLFLVSQPDDTIPYVFEEIKVINHLGRQIDSCLGKDANKQSVLAGLQSHSWVHFACHGHLEEQPFDSWFQLYKGEHLAVLDLAKAQLPNAEFAFLSACHTAAGNILGTPDESIHLAAALQFCGFKSVIGTLWAMVDDDGPIISDAFYKYIFHDAGPGNLRDAAEALNIATKALRRQSIPLDRWINFIHIGA